MEAHIYSDEVLCSTNTRLSLVLGWHMQQWIFVSSFLSHCKLPVTATWHVTLLSDHVCTHVWTSLNSNVGHTVLSYCFTLVFVAFVLSAGGYLIGAWTPTWPIRATSVSKNSSTTTCSTPPFAAPPGGLHHAPLSYIIVVWLIAFRLLALNSPSEYWSVL